MDLQGYDFGKLAKTQFPLDGSNVAPASFFKYLWRRFAPHIPTNVLNRPEGQGEGKTGNRDMAFRSACNSGIPVGFLRRRCANC